MQEAQNQMISEGHQEIDPSLSVGITTWQFESFVILPAQPLLRVRNGVVSNDSSG
jgi:hypothetical protein